MNGLPVEAHLGIKVDKLLEDIGPGIATHLVQVINTAEPITAKEIETETPAHPGESKMYIANYFPDTDENGAVVGVSCVVQDITELRQVESDLRSAKEAADAANRAKSEFLAKMRHELRTPWHTVLGQGTVFTVRLPAIKSKRQE